MPWECKGCQAVVSTDTTTTCPACGAKKVAWSMQAQRTRAFVVQSKRFDVLRGVGARPLAPGDPAAEAVRTVPAEVAWALPKAEARRLQAQGLLPPPRHVLFVRLHPRKHPDLTVSLSVLHAAREAADHALVPEGADPAADAVDVPVVLVFGEGALDPGAFPGLHVVDVSEPEAQDGHAPELEVAALRRPARRVRVSAGIVPRLVEDHTGRPAGLVYVLLGHAGEGGFELEQRCFTFPDGRLGVPRDGDGWQAGPPEEEARCLPGETLRLHWSYAPVTDLAQVRRTCEVVVAPEVRLRPARPRGRLALRLLAPDGDGWRPLAEAAVRLVPPAPEPPLEGASDDQGVLSLGDARLLGYRVEVGDLRGWVEATGEAAPLDVRLGPIVGWRAFDRLGPATGEGAADASDADADDAPAPRRVGAPSAGGALTADDLAALHICDSPLARLLATVPPSDEAEDDHGAD